MNKTKLPTTNGKEIAVEVVTITPELAEDFLKMNTHNRRKDEDTINTYASSLRRGKWILNGEPIIISELVIG